MNRQPAGAMVVAGTVSEPALLTIQGKRVVASEQGDFTTTTPIVEGTNTLTLTATDLSGNATSNQYEIDSAGAARTFTYDANGNLASDGSRTFEWDARDQLVAVNIGTHRSEFTYDGLQRRARMVEKVSGVIQTDSWIIWCDKVICEERSSDGTTVLRRAFGLGEQLGTDLRYFALDHLKSVREVTDDTGALLARYAFDPWGRKTVVSGTDVTTAGYTGMRTHVASGMGLALYRSYDPDLARWTTKDPLGDVDGPNRYAYVGNGPLIRVDPLGLQAPPLSWLLPGVKKQVKKGIETAWTSCLEGDRKVYSKSAPLNPKVQIEEWRQWQSDFTKGCQEKPSEGFVRYAICRTAIGGTTGGSAGFCSCCEQCKTKGR